MWNGQAHTDGPAISQVRFLRRSMSQDPRDKSNDYQQLQFTSLKVQERSNLTARRMWENAAVLIPTGAPASLLLRGQ